MKVVHISKTPLAGSPIRIVDCLNRYTNVEARLINCCPYHYGNRTFKEDLVWQRDKDIAIEFIKDADILHFHHLFDFNSTKNPFGFNFIENMKKSAKHLIHWHTNPMSIAKGKNTSINEIVNLKVPQMVVAQFHESYYPNAYPVPLIVEIEEDKHYRQRSKPILFYSPSVNKSAYEERWETKGKPQVLFLLKKLKKYGYCNFDFVQNIPFSECMSRRLNSDIVIDDLFTGSFHTTSLEALALGKPTVCYFDSRAQMVLSEITGTTDIPIVNAEYRYAYNIIKELAENKGLREEIGRYSRYWFNNYYHPGKMIKHYQKGYEQLLEKGYCINHRYKNFSKAKIWLYTNVQDIKWEAGKEKYIRLNAIKKRCKSKTLFYIKKIFYLLKKIITK